MITEDQYDRAIEIIGFLMDAKKDTPEGNTLSLLAELAEEYETTNFQIKAKYKE